MKPRPNMLLLVVLMAGSSIQASAAEFRKQAQLRISITIVDSCDVALVRSRSGASADDARVECSTFMPHQLTLAEWRTPSMDRRLTQVDFSDFAQAATAAKLAAPSPDDALRTSMGMVTVATVIF